MCMHVYACILYFLFEFYMCVHRVIGHFLNFLLKTP